MDKFQKSLVHLGLTEHESLVYLASLELGPAPVLRIARRAGVKRTTVYSVLDALRARGLVRVEERGLKTVYVAENPESLKRVMDTRMRELDALLPELSSLFQARGTDTLSRYEGVEGLKSVYDRLYRTFKRGDPYYVLGGSDGWKDIDPIYQTRMLEKKARMGIDTKLLFRTSRRAAIHRERRAELRQEVRVLPEAFGLKSDILITKHEVAIMHLAPPYFGIVITNPDIVATYHALFAHVWASAPPEE